jgi:hypothetical protein
MTRRHTWVPLVAAASGALLLIESVLVLASRDRLPDAPMVVMYFAGILLGVIAAVGFGLRRDRRSMRVLVGAGGVVLLVLWIIGLGEVLNPVSELFSDAAYFGDELPVGVAGGVLLLLAGIAFTHDTKVVASTPSREPVPA